MSVSRRWGAEEGSQSACAGVGTGCLLVIFGADIKSPEPRSLWPGRLRAQHSLPVGNPPSSYPFSKGLQPCSARTGLDGEAGKQPSEECDESSGWVVGVSRALLPARRSALLTSAGHLYPDVMAIRLL